MFFCASGYTQSSLRYLLTFYHLSTLFIRMKMRFTSLSSIFILILSFFLLLSIFISSCFHICGFLFFHGSVIITTCEKERGVLNHIGPLAKTTL